MHPARAKAKQTTAMVETAESVASLKADIAALAAEILSLTGTIAGLASRLDVDAAKVPFSNERKSNRG